MIGGSHPRGIPLIDGSAGTHLFPTFNSVYTCVNSFLYSGLAAIALNLAGIPIETAIDARSVATSSQSPPPTDIVRQGAATVSAFPISGVQRTLSCIHFNIFWASQLVSLTGQPRTVFLESSQISGCLAPAKASSFILRRVSRVPLSPEESGMILAFRGFTKE